VFDWVDDVCCYCGLVCLIVVFSWLSLVCILLVCFGWMLVFSISEMCLLC